MNKKGLMGILLLISTFLVSCTTTGGPGKNIFEEIITMKYLHDWGIISATIEPIEGFTRFLLLIFLFALLFKAAELLKLGKNIAVTIALVISLMTVIFIPSTILLTVGTTYGTVFSLILLAAPVLLGLGGYFLLKEYHWIRAILMGGLWFILWQMDDHIKNFAVGASASYAGVVNTVAIWIGYVTWAVGIMFFITLFQAFTNMGGSTDHHPNWLRGLWNRAAQGTVLTEKGKELRHARVEETRILSDLAVEKEELGLLEKAKEDWYGYNKIFDEIKKNNTVNSENHLDSLNTTFESLKESVKEVVDVQHKWKRAERREIKETARLIAEINKQSINQSVKDEARNKVLTSLKKKNNDILGWYAAVADAVKKAERAFEQVDKSHVSFYGEIKKKYDKKNANKIAPVKIGPNEKGLVNLLDTIHKNLTLLITEIETARQNEKIAVEQTAILAEEIKKEWIV